MEFPVEIDGEELNTLRELRDKAQTNSKAQVMLGEAFFTGDGVPHDYRKALSYFEKAADNGDSQGMLNLAYMYRKGISVDVDLLKTEQLCLRAYECGDKEALGALAEMYIFGMGPVKQDIQRGMGYAYKAIHYRQLHDAVCGWFGGEEEFINMHAVIASCDPEDVRLHMLGQKLRQDQSPEYKKYEPEGLYD